MTKLDDNNAKKTSLQSRSIDIIFSADMSIKHKKRGERMMFEDKEGILLTPEEVDELSSWEIDERRIHIYDNVKT